MEKYERKEQETYPSTCNVHVIEHSLEVLGVQHAAFVSYLF